MKFVELREVAEFIRGITYKPDELVENFSENSAVCMRTANVQKNLDESNLLSVPTTLIKNDQKYLLEGDILVSTANSWNLVGKCSWVHNLDYKATAGGFIAILRANGEMINPRYLYHWFNSEPIQIQARNCGRQTTNISNMDIDRCLSIKIYLPSLEEQRRIASILDKADEIRQKRQQAIAKLDKLLQATFIDMFGDESDDYKGFDKVNLLDKVDFLTGYAFKSNEFKSSGIKLCRGINVLPGQLDWNSTAYWDKSELDKFKKFELEEEDIVIAMDRPWISSGFKISMIGEKDKEILLVQRVARLRSKESCYASFIYHLLDSHNFKNHCNVTETTIPHISPTDFKTFLIPNAPKAQILKFDKLAKGVRVKKQSMQIALMKSEDFFNSLQQKAFNGTL